MAVSVRMDPLLEIELQQAADRQGVTKSQFIIAAAHSGASAAFFPPAYERFLMF